MPEQPTQPPPEPNLAPLPTGLFCPQCDYDLRGLTSNRCPECGFSLEDVRTGTSRLPWPHRAEMGRFLAYWRTVALVTLHPRAFASEIIRPVSFKDAQSFRRLTILHVYSAILIASLAALIHWWNHATAFFGPLTIPTFLATQVGIVLALFAATTVPRYFFHPRHLPTELQNRAIALSYYASASLLWYPTLFALLVLLAALGPSNVHFAEASLVLTVYLSLCPLLLICHAFFRLARRSLRANRTRALLTALAAPLLALIVATATLLAVPAVVLYIATVLGSLL